MIDGPRLGEIYENSLWCSKGHNSGNSEVTHNGGYSCVEDERVVGKGYCLGSAVEIRRCAILPKEEKQCCFTEEVTGGVVVGGYGFGGPLDIPHKKDDMLMYGMREVNSSGACSRDIDALSQVKSSSGVTKDTIPWKSESSEGCYHQPTSSEAYQGFLGSVHEQVKAEGLQLGRQHNFHCGFLEEQSSDCLSGDRDSLDLGSPDHRPVGGLQDDLCHVKSDPESSPTEFHQGERRQKKRDQNKTAAHRYRQRKRAELDTLEEQLHGLEGRNRELRDKAESVEREIQYVKDLLIEVYKARSQRLKQDTNA